MRRALGPDYVRNFLIGFALVGIPLAAIGQWFQ
jgi:hypothetical protein